MKRYKLILCAAAALAAVCACTPSDPLTVPCRVS